MEGAPDDLIVAPATAAGRGALAVVRLSGRDALGVASRLSGGTTWTPQRATRVRLRLADGVREDAVITAWVAPHSFTGQDLVEISSHGSPVIVDLVLRACFEAGARMARTGEFTLRAYLNGRLDLLQAEAVADLVAATTAAQVRVASAHLEGVLSERIRALGDALAEVRALLEASLDFPDEGFLFIEPDDLSRRLDAAVLACTELLGSADAGRRLHDGATVVIAGRPNAGKSSLFNALLRRQRAIVTAIPGTTRDLLTEMFEVGGVPVTLVDTAGLRETDDVVEREGVARTGGAVTAADLVIVVVNPLAAPGELEHSRHLWESVERSGAICVVSHADAIADAKSLPGWLPASAVRVSSVTQSGVADLEGRMAAALGQASWQGATLTRARHRALVGRCRDALTRGAALACSGGSEEYVLADVHDALVALEELRGVETPDEVLETIFSSFCIGK